VLTATGLIVGVVVSERQNADRLVQEAEARLKEKETEAAEAARGCTTLFTLACCSVTLPARFVAPCLPIKTAQLPSGPQRCPVSSRD
jgi:hypothetical protein